MCENCEQFLNPYNSVVESIALEQAGLSHILNAEGEKIQKVLSFKTDLQNVLLVNKSVSETVRAVSELEIILTNKLKIATHGRNCTNCCDEKGFCKCNIDGGEF
ncbi:MAG: hypothetical protein RR400_02430 [Clostridia bacterium]